MDTPRRQRRYDHRLVELVRRTGDVGHATKHGIPRSTAAGWITRRSGAVVSLPHLDESAPELLVRVARLEKRVERLRAILAIAIALLRILQPDLTRLRVPDASDKRRLLRALDQAGGVLGLRRVLRAIGLSPSRLASWRRAARGCELDDESSSTVPDPNNRHSVTGMRLRAKYLGRAHAATTQSRLSRCVAPRHESWFGQAHDL